MDAVTALALILGVAIFIGFFLTNFINRSKQKGNGESIENVPADQQPKQQSKQLKKTQQKAGIQPRARKQSEFSHPCVATALKAHSGTVTSLAVSNNGKFLCSAGEDGQLLLWAISELDVDSITPTNLQPIARCQIEFDTAKLVAFSPDCKAILALQASANRLGVYKLVKGDGGGKWKYRLMAAEVEYPRHHLHDVISVGIAETGRWLMSASMDTQICLWDLKGNLLHEVDTKIGTQHQAVVEPTGRFLAVCGFTPDVKVFEVKFDAKSGAFLECKRAFELKGHNSGVWSVSFSADAKRALTISKDGTFHVYDTDIRYAQGEDAHLLHSGSLDCLRDVRHRSMCALAPSASSFAIAHATSLYLFAVDAEQPVVEFDNVHSASITSVVYSTDSRFVFTAGDRHVRCFHNVAGWQHQLRHASVQLAKAPKSSSALRERLQQQIDEAESILSKLGV